MSENGDRPELPEGWEWRTMGDIARVVGGSTPKSKEPSYWDGDIPWLAVSDLTGYTDKYISHGARSITKAGFESCATQMLPKGAVVFSSRAPIGYVAIAARSLCTSQGFKSFVLEEEIDPEYVYWYLRSAKPLTESLASGTTFKELSGKRAATIPIPVPPADQQVEIAARISDLVGATQAATMSLTGVGRGIRRFSVVAARAAVADAGGSKRALDDVVEVLDRLRIPVNRNERADREGDIPYYGATGQVGWIDDHLFDEELVLLGEDGVPFLDPFKPKAYVIRGKSWVNNHAHVLRPKHDLIDAGFLKHVLDEFDYSALVGGTTRLKLTRSAMARMAIAVPPLADQRAALKRLGGHLEARDILNASLKDTRLQSDGLERSIMASAFAGRLNPGSEPREESGDRVGVDSQ